MTSVFDRLFGANEPGESKKSPLEQKFEGLLKLSEDERACLRSLQSSDVEFTPRADLVDDGVEHERVYVIVSGWGMRYKTLEDGRRQVLSFVLPGDIIGLYACISPLSNCAVGALTTLRACALEPLTLLDLFGKYPRVAALLCWGVKDDEAILREQVVRIGRRSALERTAHLLLEVQQRLQRVRPSRADDRVYFPITQELLADTLGLSVVHTNRVLRRLRQDGLLKMEARHFEILDWHGMARAAKFDDDYLEKQALPGATQAKLA